MTRTATGLGIAAALGVAVSLGAQTTSTTTADQRTATRSDKGREISVTGCLARGSDGTYMLNNARMEANTNPTTTTAGTTGTAGTTATPSPSTTTAAGATTTGAPMTWKLEGGSDLDKHVGHKIEVTGRTEWNEHSSMPSGSTATTTTGTSGASSKMTSEPRLDVSSVKMISSSCQ
jgi:hypothetical protein